MRAIALLVTSALAASGCGGGSLGVAVPAPRTTADVRADALVEVARRIYDQEVAGVAGRAAVRRIAGDRRLGRALASGNREALRAEALRQLFMPGRHVVRLRVVRSGRTLVDVGGRFVAGGAAGPLLGPDGRALGRLELSLQDVLGYRKLVRRLTGAEVLVRGRAGHVESSLPAAAAASLPRHGTVSLDGRAYVVREFHERGFGEEPLSVWLLAPGA